MSINQLLKALQTFFVFAALLLVSSVAWAIPAYNGDVAYVQPDGTTIIVHAEGDEHAHALFTSDGHMVSQVDGVFYYVFADGGRLAISSVIAHSASDRTSAEVDTLLSHQSATILDILNSGANKNLCALSQLGRTTFPTIGNIRGLILLVEFADVSFNENYDSEYFSRAMNADNFDDYGATSSARQYFVDQSRGRFTPNFDVVGPVRLGRSVSYYGQNSAVGQDINAGEMVREACARADTAYNVDFSKYDNDADGIADFVYVIYAGYGESYGAPAYTIWPHQSTLTDYYISQSLDGVQIDRYACSCELKYATGTTVEGIGTFCHEFGHVLGLPDFYQTDGGSKTQMGEWSIMDKGCYNNYSRTPAGYSGYERYCLGWLDFTDLDQAMPLISLPAIDSSNVALRLTSSNPNEFYVLETRRLAGWDAYLPAEGLMITHVDYSESAWEGNYVNNNDDHPRYTIVPADGTQGYALEGDLFPGTAGNTQFTDFSSPSSILYDGSRLNKALTGIAYADGVSSFAFMQDKLTKPLDVAFSNVGNQSATISWTPVSNALSYSVRLQQILDESVLPIPIDEDFSLMTNGSYTSQSSTNLSALLDSFTVNRGWTGQLIFSAGGACRVGAQGKIGILTTPNVFAQAVDSVTIAFRVRAAATRSVNYVVEVLRDGVADEVFSFKATADQQDQVISVRANTQSLAFRLQTNYERLFVDKLKIIRGPLTTSNVWDMTNPQVVVDGLTSCVCDVSGLQSGADYEVYVQAISADVLCNSPLSDVVLLKTVGLPTAQKQTISHATPVAVYDLGGRRVSCSVSSPLPAGQILIVVSPDGSRHKIFRQK